MSLRAKVLTVSDGVAEGVREDKSGVALVDALNSAGYDVAAHEITADGTDTVAAALTRLADLRLGTDPLRRPRAIGAWPAGADRERLRSIIPHVRGLADAPPEILDALVDDAVMYRADIGVLVTRVGDRAEWVWILWEGEVELSAASGGVHTLRPGAVFGDAAAADDCPLDVTAVAVGSCRLAALGAVSYRQALGSA